MWQVVRKVDIAARDLICLVIQKWKGGPSRLYEAKWRGWERMELILLSLL